MAKKFIFKKGSRRSQRRSSVVSSSIASQVIEKIYGYKYSDFHEAVNEHKSDFVVYMIDILPLDEICVPGYNYGYIGSAGANAERAGETKTGGTYIKGSLDARYRSGSYTLFSTTRDSQVEILLVSFNDSDEGERVGEFRKRANTPGFKREERDFLGYLEYRLWKVAEELEVPLGNREEPNHMIFPDYDKMTDQEFFKSFEVEGHTPALIQIARGDISLQDYIKKQEEYAEIFIHDVREFLDSEE